jgi:hypothetical protein
LRQAEAHRRAANAALGEHCIEDRKQVEVDVLTIHGLNIFNSRYLLEARMVWV